ncbi:Hypothetical predicted protein [Mytilus galloprovincialis]|uniref:Endonuclease/exonuclease/phosphatase domain-containing protein n=1 Tax=Mytilus galloprovincialis TaxID=29158 RepID=A0A8B6CKT1_MYTGA|nr:Hypothetical predicted protein [Mytilus galloprovincialis]
MLIYVLELRWLQSGTTIVYMYRNGFAELAHDDYSDSPLKLSLLAGRIVIGNIEDPEVQYCVFGIYFCFIKKSTKKQEQSIVPKLELIAAEYSCHELLSFTESWLSPQVSNEAILLPGYKTPFRRDRVGKAGGGVIVYVKDNLNCSERRDLVVCGIECIWLEVRFKTKKYLYGTFYVPPNSSPQVWDNIEQSIDLALSCNLDIIVTGDFNTNQLRNTTNDRISMIKAQFSLHQVISDPTYITEHSSSLLDLILVNDPVNLLFSDVGAPLLDQIRYHLPVIGILTQPCKLHQVFKRKVYMYDRGDYDSYRHQLSLVDWDALFISNDVDVIARAITDELIDKADKNIPNRIITVRKDKPPWLTADIKRMIRKKNRIHKRAKKKNSAPDWTKFRLVRNKCNKLVLNSKTDYFSKLSTKIISETHGGKQYWSLIKSLMKCDSSDSRNIPPLQIDDDLICEDTKKAKIFNDYFCGQSNLDDSNTHLPDIPDTRTDGLGDMIISENEVVDILKILDVSKASGPDQKLQFVANTGYMRIKENILLP